jgi:hypothetical protein
MGVVQKIAPTAEQAVQAGIEIAMRIAACGPLGIKATLASAHLAIDSSTAEVLSKLDAQYRALYGTQDFEEEPQSRSGRSPADLPLVSEGSDDAEDIASNPQFSGTARALKSAVLLTRRSPD